MFLFITRLITLSVAIATAEVLVSVTVVVPSVTNTLFTPDSDSSTLADAVATGRATTTDDDPIWMVWTRTDAADWEGMAAERGKME